MTLEGAPEPPTIFVRSNLQRPLGLCSLVAGIIHDGNGEVVRVAMQLSGEIGVECATPIHKRTAPAREGGGLELNGRAA